MKDFKIKVGDLVKLRDDLIDDRVYGTMFYTKYMKFKGFRQVKELNNVKKFARIKPNNDSHYYNYTKEMIAEVKRPKYETIYKREEPILDDKEKEYLSNVIRPFKDEVNALVKMAILKRKYICIKLENECVYLPYFNKDTMYKNMELNTEYTLEELGL